MPRPALPHLSAVCAAAVVLGAGPARDELAFTPAADAGVTRTFRATTSWTLELLDMRLDGSAVEQDLPDVSGLVERSVVVADVYGEREGRRLLGLRRTFEELACRSSFDVDAGGSPMSFTVRSESSLADDEVAFRWDPDDETYARELVDGDTGSEGLAGLELDMDLVGFLPPGEVEVGESWEVELDAVRLLFQPGGDLRLLPVEADEGSIFTVPSALVVGSALIDLAEAAVELEGEVEATWAGVDQNGLGVIELSFELASEADLAERFAVYIEAALDDPDAEDVELDLAIDFEGEGTLLWDREAGRLASFGLEGESTITASLGWNDSSLVVDGESARMEADLDLQAETRIEVTVEAE